MMLQWMGGSRRKVTTSRQSTQKRQKQYFEQRKRQQQKQQTGAESFADGTNLCSHQDNNQSLDILSLLNLSTVVQNYNSSCNRVRENLEGGDAMLDCHTSKGQPIIQAAKVTPVEPAEIREQGYPTGCQVESVYSKKVLSGDHDIQTLGLTANDERRGKLKLSNEHCYFSGCQTETKCGKTAPEGQKVESIRGGDRRDKLKTASGQQLSVFDLLGDDGPNGNYEENPSSEAHMAFIMEGLGEMGTETPVHSPEHSTRIFSYGPVSPIKAPRQSQFFKNPNSFLHDLELEAAAMTQNTDLPLCGSSIEPPFFPKDTCNSFNKTKDTSTTNESWRFINNDGKSKNSFADDEMLWEIDNGTDDNWNSAPNFRDGPGLHENIYISWKNPPLRMDGFSADCWNTGIQETSDFTSIGPSVPKISIAEKTRKFNISDRYCKQQRAEKTRDLRTSPDAMWSPKVGRHCGISYVTSEPVWPSYLTEDAGDSLNLLSEESCSSSAVRGKAIKKRQAPLSTASQKKERHCIGAMNPVNKSSVENIFISKDYEQLDDFCEGKKYDCEKFTNICNAPISNPTHISNKFNKRVRPQNNFLFDEEYDFDKMDARFGPFCQRLETEIHASPDPNLWNENHFGAYSGSHSHGKMKSTFERSECGLSPCGDCLLGKNPFCQPSSHLISYKTPIFTTNGSGPRKRDLCVDTDVDIPQCSSPISGSWREAKEAAVGNGEEDESEVKASNCEKLELRKDACIGSNVLSSEDERPTEASGSRESCGTSNRVKELIPEMENPIEIDSPVHLKEQPPPLKIINKFGKEDHSDAQPSLPHKSGNTEWKLGVEGRSLKERKLETEGGNVAPDPSYQVMLESYVLQLLCVQKMPKEASVHDPVKKVQ